MKMPKLAKTGIIPKPEYFCFPDEKGEEILITTKVTKKALEECFEELNKETKKKKVIVVIDGIKYIMEEK